MNLRVRALDFTYEDDGMTIKNVNTRFEITSTDGNFLNGSVTLSKEEYASMNSGSMEELSAIIKTKLKEQIESL